MLADETTDIKTTEQAYVCVRYIATVNESIVVKEDFLEFVPVHNVTGNELASTIDTLRGKGLLLKHLYGTGYDGSAAMSGQFRGVQAVVREEFPKALYVHCSAHALNLALWHSCSVQSVRNYIGTVKATKTFFRSSAKRTAKARYFRGLSSSLSILGLCETRWIEKHGAVL